MKYLLFCLFCCATAWAGEPVPLRVVTENLPPLNYEEQGEVRGISTEIVRAVLDRAGIAYRIEVLPWARAYRTAKETPGVLIYSIGRIPEREASFVWVGPMFSYYESLWRLKARRDIHVSNFAEARLFRIGVVRDYAVHQGLRARGLRDGMELDPSDSQEQSLRKLFSGRIDLIVASRPDLEWRLRRHPAIGQIEAMEETLVLRDLLAELNMAFARNTDPVLVRRVEKAWQALRSEGFVTEALRRHHYNIDAR